MVGMAGFEPAASCSQISSGPWPGVARGGHKRLLPAVIVAHRRLALPRICRHWLPQLAPLSSLASLMFGCSNAVTNTGVNMILNGPQQPRRG